MNETHVRTINVAETEWPARVKIPAHRILTGAPAASTLTLEESGTHQLGLWQVTPGAFTTDHAGYLEYIHVTKGRGRLVSDTGVVQELSPGTTTVIPVDWKGRWEIDNTLTKVYTIIRT
ncbi:cupin domain-containing protein [Paenarthrobacter sp. NPDC090522]|uniref:cupin domain-containing protein n=1 Tax=Paenarthrobacter sp. NPDC090522 TaxID=3364383 RepID=UPI00382C2815